MDTESSANERRRRTGDRTQRARARAARRGDAGPARQAEAALVARLRRGDPEAFASFFRQQRDPLLRLGVRLLRCPQEAEDCFQEVMLKVQGAIDRFDGRASLGTWTYRIMRNACLMRLRSRRRRREVLAPLATDGIAIQTPAVRPDADRGLEDRDCARIVREAMDQLRPSYRRILELRDFEERSTAEVAERLGISTTNAKVRLHRARAALRRSIEGNAEEEFLGAYRGVPIVRRTVG